MRVEQAIGRLLAAIESRDLRAIEGALAPDASWQNVPHDAAIGRDAVLALLGPIVTWSDRVRWDVVSAAYDDRQGWLERVDRFWIDGDEYAVRCLGVFVVDDGRVAEVRDYVDLGEWRARVAPALARCSARTPEQVVARHLDAVRRADGAGMVADYAPDAVLVRERLTLRGWRAIGEYFAGVPARLAGRQVELAEPRPDADGTVCVEWAIGDASSGLDRYRVESGRIVQQTVTLHGPDF